MTRANFKPLEATMEELVEYLEGVECSETENPTKRNSKAAVAQKQIKTKTNVSVARRKIPPKLPLR
eukprot:2961963-Ditylum_brightwellii.AAC.2